MRFDTFGVGIASGALEGVMFPIRHTRYVRHCVAQHQAYRALRLNKDEFLAVLERVWYQYSG